MAASPGCRVHRLRVRAFVKRPKIPNESRMCSKISLIETAAMENRESFRAAEDWGLALRGESAVAPQVPADCCPPLCNCALCC